MELIFTLCDWDNLLSMNLLLLKMNQLYKLADTYTTVEIRQTLKK